MKYINKIIIAVWVISLFALQIPSTLADDFIQDYSTDTTLLSGAVVELVNADENKVQAINIDSADNMFGVVVRPSDSAVTLTKDTKGVLIATNGRFEVLATDLNGPIKAGDYITISSLTGIAMKSDANQGFVLGTALQDFDTSKGDNILSQSSTLDPDGVRVNASIGKVLAEIKIGPNPEEREKQRAPKFLISVTEAVAGKPVSVLRIYASVIVLVVAAVIAGSLLYSAIKNSMVSIGRNPLSRKSVYKGLGQVVIVSLIIFISGIVGVYFILTV